MHNISKRLIVAIIVLIIAIMAGGWFWYVKQKSSESTLPENGTANTTQNTVETKDATRFVTDVDMDVSHWQTGETEFLSMKFPKEWHWLEIPPEKPGYFGAYVISNNPNFPLSKYSDIGGIGAELSYPLILTNDTEVIIATNNLGWPTSNSGTPREFMDGQIAKLKKDLYPEMKCHYISSLTSVPLTAFCSFVDSNNQKVQTYYIAYNMRTFAFTARTTEKNTFVGEDLLGKIAKSLIVKSKSFN